MCRNCCEIKHLGSGKRRRSSGVFWFWDKYVVKSLVKRERPNNEAKAGSRTARGRKMLGIVGRLGRGALKITLRDFLRPRKEVADGLATRFLFVMCRFLQARSGYYSFVKRMNRPEKELSCRNDPTAADKMLSYLRLPADVQWLKGEEFTTSQNNFFMKKTACWEIRRRRKWHSGPAVHKTKSTQPKFPSRGSQLQMGSFLYKAGGIVPSIPRSLTTALGLQDRRQNVNLV